MSEIYIHSSDKCIMVHHSTFLKALKFVLKWEGGYVNNPYDKGGPTNRGITQKVYDNYLAKHYKPNKPVRMLSEYEMEDIYYNSYWISAGCNRLEPKLAIALFDFSVNSGVARALRYLKLSSNNLDKYLDKRKEFFKLIGKGSQRVFLKGWLNRLQALREYLIGVE